MIGYLIQEFHGLFIRLFSKKTLNKRIQSFRKYGGLECSRYYVFGFKINMKELYLNSTFLTVSKAIMNTKHQPCEIRIPDNKDRYQDHIPYLTICRIDISYSQKYRKSSIKYTCLAYFIFTKHTSVNYCQRFSSRKLNKYILVT